MRCPRPCARNLLHASLDDELKENGCRETSTIPVHIATSRVPSVDIRQACVRHSGCANSKMDQCNSMECLRCLIVSCGGTMPMEVSVRRFPGLYRAHHTSLCRAGPDPHQIQLSIRKFLDEYIWEQDGFMLYSMRQTPCPWKCPLPNESQMEYMWSEIHHCGSVEDEWFLVFLLSYITDLFKVW